MPTATKLVSALIFAVVGLWAALEYIPQLPEGTDVGFFPQIMVVLGFIIGWRSLGRTSGKGYGEAVGHGLRTSVLLAFWALFGFSTYTMIMRSTKQIYRADPGRALLDIPKIMMEYGRLIGAQEVVIALVVGGVVGGVLAEMTARRWS
jgi:hypothetical protein